jgi:hypothetical protein
MRLWKTGIALATVVGLVGPAAGKSPVKPAPTCGEYGTSVHFEDTPASAARQAQKDEKLVLVLHVSGHFENPEFT